MCDCYQVTFIFRIFIIKQSTKNSFDIFYDSDKKNDIYVTSILFLLLKMLRQESFSVSLRTKGHVQTEDSCSCFDIINLTGRKTKTTTFLRCSPFILFARDGLRLNWRIPSCHRRELIRFTLYPRYLNEANLHSYATQMIKYGDTIKLMSLAMVPKDECVCSAGFLLATSKLHDNDSNAASCCKGRQMDSVRGIQTGNQGFAI